MEIKYFWVWSQESLINHLNTNFRYITKYFSFSEILEIFINGYGSMSEAQKAIIIEIDISQNPPQFLKSFSLSKEQIEKYLILL